MKVTLIVDIQVVEMQMANIQLDEMQVEVQLKRQMVEMQMKETNGEDRWKTQLVIFTFSCRLVV